MKKVLVLLFAAFSSPAVASMNPAVEASGFGKALAAKNAAAAVNAFNSNQAAGSVNRTNALGYLYMNVDIASFSMPDQAKLSGMIGDTPPAFSSGLKITPSNRKWLLQFQPDYAKGTIEVAEPSKAPVTPMPAPSKPAPKPMPAPVPAPVPGGPALEEQIEGVPAAPEEPQVEGAGDIPEAPPLPDDGGAAADVKNAAAKPAKPVAPKPAGKPGVRPPSAADLAAQRAGLKPAKPVAPHAKPKPAGKPGVPLAEEVAAQKAQLKPVKPVAKPQKDEEGLAGVLQKAAKKHREKLGEDADDDASDAGDADNGW